ncbi:hypothetical protein HPB52_021959 [Rhipicephalus sanguineus]|uniref:DDE Tnp4 domain-containing protein n=1 Tax=Rhipicephalus sanguineus TaxID=34632 RepID=A0A9D4Q810_RHISA|nr:hypothetical protein HPB52_021959 [Rhipicephalus sanguineus]
MSDEAEDMKKKVALAMAALTDTEVELEASAGKVRAIKRQIIANSCLVAAMASSSFRGPREAWAYARHAVVDSLEERWVRMPTPSEMEDHIKEFQLTLGFPQGVGALDGCHFPVSPPKEYASDYYNYKGW